MIAGNLLALAICAGWPLLSPVPGGPWMPHLLLRAGDALRDCAALALIFFVPGTALIVFFSSRNAIPLSELLVRGFAANVAFLVAATSAVKLAGVELDRSIMLAAMAFALAVSFLQFFRSRRLPAVTNDLPFPPLFCLTAAISFILLFVFLAGYTLLEPSDHWLVEQAGAVRFPAEGIPVSVRYDGHVSQDGRFVSLPRGTARAFVARKGPGGGPVTIGYLVQSGTPGEFAVVAGETEKRVPVPAPFPDGGREVRFQNQAIATMELALPPGGCGIGLRFTDASGAPAPCTVLDFTGLAREQFLREFTRRYRFVTYVLMYDIMEAEDFTANLSRRISLYHSPGTPEAPGYAVTNPPLSYLFASFGCLLMGAGMAAINKVGFALLAVSFFVSLGLMHAGLGRLHPPAAVASLIGTLTLATLLAAGVSLHFMTHFMFLCVLIAAALLHTPHRWLPAAFLLMACLSAWAGYYFTALSLTCLAAVRREIRRPARLLAAVTVPFCVFLAALIAAGRSLGALPAWTDELLWENFRRFGTAHLHQAGSKRAFFTYALMGSACMPLSLALRRDAVVRFFALFALLYAATLLCAPSNEWKVHYLPTLCFPLMIAGGRAMALAARRGTGGMFRRLIETAVVGGAAGAFILALAWTSRGVLAV